MSSLHEHRPRSQINILSTRLLRVMSARLLRVMSARLLRVMSARLLRVMSARLLRKSVANVCVPGHQQICCRKAIIDLVLGVLVWSELADMPSHPLADAKLGDVASHLDISGQHTVCQQTFALCRQKIIKDGPDN